MKAVSPQMQDTQRNSSTKNLKKIIPSHILIKVLKTTARKKKLKGTRGKKDTLWEKRQPLQ